MKKILIIGLCSLSLAGCIATGGQAAYEVEPIVAPDGSVICCKATVHNTKDVDLVEVDFQKLADGSIKMTVKEKGVKASDAAAIAAETNKALVDAVLKKVPIGG